MKTDALEFIRRNLWPMIALLLVIVTATVYSWESIATRYDPDAAEEQLIFYPLVTSGTDYRHVAYPQQVDTIRVLADTPFVLNPRYSEVSFWPVTREYRPDLRQRNEPVADATLELIHPDGTVEAIEPDTFTIWYEDGVTASDAEFFHGDDAVARYDRYVEEGRAYADAAREHQIAQGQYESAVDEWLGLAAEGVDPLPDPPEEPDTEAPEPYNAFAREPEDGLVLTLDPGAYTIRLRDADGQLIPGSERELVAFAPLDTDYGYDVILAERWTQPLRSLNPNHVVYVTAGTEIYLQPRRAEQYTAGNFGRVFAPQTVEIANDAQRIWIPVADEGDDGVDTTRLHVDGPASLPDILEAQPYRVTQIPNRQFGYVIEQFDPAQHGGGVEPDFEAIRVRLEQPSTATVSLQDPQTGERLGVREIRSVAVPSRALLYLPALLPLLVFAGVTITRRRALQDDA
ncbi:MAG: hypothetical protein WD011_06120 [Nitriliruptoraceae bacterium]